MSIAKKLVTETSITFQWADGIETAIEFDSFNEDIQQHARNHGLSQKLGDSYSGAVNCDEARERFEATLAALMDGDWNRKGVATGGLWVAAIAQATGKSPDEVLEKWQAMDEATRKAVCKHPDVILARKQIDLQRAEAKAKNAPALEL